MENILSITILAFILIFIGYDFYQKRKKKKESSPKIKKDNISTQTNAEGEVNEGSLGSESSNENTESAKPEVQNDVPADNIEYLNLNDKENKTVKKDKMISPEDKIKEIEEIVRQGLYAGGNLENCLKEIQKIISND